MLDPQGSARNHFRASPSDDAYQRGVKPDFVMSDGRWVDFKLHVSLRDKAFHVPWRPSALYSSLRKYLDHPANKRGTLTIIYGRLHGSPHDVAYPVSRGRKVLIASPEEFEAKVKMVDVERLLVRLGERDTEQLGERIRGLLVR
ncbi:MAG: hypothetical protein AB1938_22540 [Myxococcota bacterium]